MARVLVFPGSTRVAREVVESLSPLPHYLLFGAGYSEQFPWLSAYKGYEQLPAIADPSFRETFLRALDSFSITHVIPANEAAIVGLTSIMFESGVKLVGHPYETVTVAGSKRRTLEKFRGSPFFPNFFCPQELPDHFPVFFKPDIGHSSIGTGLFHSEAELRSAETKGFSWDEYVVTEFLPGREVTVDCFSTLDRGLLFARPRLRQKVDQGISRHTVDLFDESLIGIARHINSTLEFSGAWFFQARESVDGKFRVLEIGARIAGASGIRRGQGVNLSHLSVLATDGIDLEVFPASNPSEATLENGRVFFGGKKKFSRLYVDLDDTLILNGKISSPVMSLIDEAYHAGVWTAIITRATYDPHKRLEGLGLSRFFKEVIHIQDNKSKEFFIPRESFSVLIDDSFRERKACIRRPEILAVDASASTGLGGMLIGIQ